MNREIQPLLQEIRTGLDELYGARLSTVILYGSHARGDAREGSDVDVLVVLEGQVDPAEEIERTLDLTMKLLTDHGELVVFNHASEAEYADRLHPLMMNVSEEGVPL